VVALYVMLYTAGRGWIENLRIDDVQMDDVLGLRLNVWTSIVLFVLAAAYFAWSVRRHPGREETVRTREPDAEPDPESEDADSEQPAGPTA
jgi:prolipoprotein diacylglyceryltransferase